MRFSTARVIFSVATTSTMITRTHSSARITQAIEYWGGVMISGGAGSASGRGAVRSSGSGTGIAVLPRPQQGDHVVHHAGLTLGEHVADVQTVEHLGDALSARAAIRLDIARDPLRGPCQGGDLARGVHVDDVVVEGGALQRVGVGDADHDHVVPGSQP